MVAPLLSVAIMAPSDSVACTPSVTATEGVHPLKFHRGSLLSVPASVPASAPAREADIKSKASQPNPKAGFGGLKYLTIERI